MPERAAIVVAEGFLDPKAGTLDHRHQLLLAEQSHTLDELSSLRLDVNVLHHESTVGRNLAALLHFPSLYDGLVAWNQFLPDSTRVEEIDYECAAGSHDSPQVTNDVLVLFIGIEVTKTREEIHHEIKARFAIRKRANVGANELRRSAIFFCESEKHFLEIGTRRPPPFAEVA